MTRILNDAGLDLIASNEGLRLTAYQDVAGVWTIGYGHTGDVSPTDRITPDEARQLLGQDLRLYRAAVDSATNGKATDNQFAAMVSLAYNIGCSAFRGSSVVRAHNAGNFHTAAEAFLLWYKAHVDGTLQSVPGLLKRREAESKLYETA